MGMVDNTLFTKKKSSNLIIVQIYVDDITFGLTCQDMCDEFAKIMHDEFEMSVMGELNFFLGLQIKQMEDDIFFNQCKYIKEMLKKFGIEDSKPIKTPMSPDTKLMKDEECKSVDSTKYRGMIDTTHLGLWYPKGTGIETVVYADSDHAGDYVDRKSTRGICIFVGCCLTSWFSKKQTALAISTTEAEYVSTEKASQQALWMKQACWELNVYILSTAKIEVSTTNAILVLIKVIQEMAKYNGNYFKPVAETTTDDAGTSTTLITGPVTIEEMAKKKNDVKARISTVFGVSTASPQVSTANLSDATVYAFLANQPNGSQLMHEDLEQIYEDDLEEMDLKWKLALLSIRAKRVPRNQENRTRNQETTKRTVNMEDTSSKAMVAIDGAGFDWSYMADDEAPINMAFMALSDSEKVSPLRIDLSYTGLQEFAEPSVQSYGVRIIEVATQKSRVKISAPVKENNGAPLIEVWNQMNRMRLNLLPRKRERLLNLGHSHKQIEDQGYFDSGCSWHMTGIYPISLTSRSLMEGMLHLGEELKVVRLLTKEQPELKIRTLTEAARTMLANSKLPITFWAEAVNTACNLQNRVLVVKPHFKTPYELFRGRTSALSFVRPFGCHVTILNTLDHLGKVDGKSDEGFFFGYSTNIKAFRVYNTKTRKVEENLHIKFMENKPLIVGDGPKWLFDIDTLTESMKYVLVIVGTNSNDFIGKRASFDAGQSSIETGPSQDYILMSLWNDGSLFDSSPKDSNGDN
uniref:Retrovirus-related Pol polyprotein from transposon TNT 1-94 n=1 Tax=Tanacetum cinerariifolium TaxID=118510 RepID=A0A6L2MU15_TANCI|nr:retrovirus-related Pol polyprotein from transposon TNT 1-94 [Tanacetum cinerariifolium]